MKQFVVFFVSLSIFFPALAQVKEFKSQDALQLVLHDNQLLKSLGLKQNSLDELSLSVTTSGEKLNKQFIVSLAQTTKTSAGLKTCKRQIFIAAEKSRLMVSKLGHAECKIPALLAAAQ
jgi:hypothetical protein